MMIHQNKEVSIDIGQCPWQFLSIAVEELAIRNRNATVAAQRTLLRDHKCEIDKALYADTLKCHCSEDRMWLKHVGNLGIWADNKLATFTVEKDPKCRYCGAADGNAVHLTLLCPHFQQARIDGDPDLGDLDMASLPAPMQIGIPVINRAVEGQALWPRAEQEINNGDDRKGFASKVVLRPVGRALLLDTLYREGNGLSLTTRQLMASM